MQQIGRNCAVSKIGGEKEEKKKKLEQQSRKKGGGRGMAKSLRHLHVYRVALNIRLGCAFHGLTFGVFGKALSRCGGRETGYTRLAWRGGAGGGTKKIEIFSLLLFLTLLFRPPLCIQTRA